jgi:DUF4097 and DUF4098 domain-containing protein YvlB
MKTTHFVAVVAVAMLLAPGVLAQTPPAPPPLPVPGPAPPAHPAKPVVRGPQQVEKLSRTIQLEDGATVSIENMVGNVAVTVGKPGELRLEAVKRARGDRDAALRHLEETRVEITERPGRVRIRTVSDAPRARVAVDYALVVPPATVLEVRSITGDIAVTGVRGDVRAETVRGSIKAIGLQSTAALRAVVGDVRVETSTLEGDLTANSVSGVVVLTGLKARYVTAGTVSGDLRLLDGVYERLEAQSINGNVELAGALLRGGRYQVQSHAGNIRVLVHGRTGFTLEANTFSGHVDSSRVQLRNANDPGRLEGTETARRMRGVYGDGSAQVILSSFSGNVVVVTKN